MALHRGIQSAIFYYVSCTPCAEMRVRKRRKQEAERDRADRAELELRMPGLYRHPEPDMVNPYWQAEIDAGPIPSRVKKRQAESSRVAVSTRSNIASSVSVADDVSMERSDSAKSGLGVQQRQDEVLWGQKAPDMDLQTGCSIDSGSTLPQRLPRAKISDPPTTSRYQYVRNAAVNDMHPPTTRRIESKEEVMWMLQPPPLPEVMNGKVTDVPSRSNSHLSKSDTVSRSTISSRKQAIPRSIEGVSIDRSPSLLAIPQSHAAPAIQLPAPSLQPNEAHNSWRTQQFLTVRPTKASEKDEPQRAASLNTKASRPANISVPAPGTIRAGGDAADDVISDSVASPANVDTWQGEEAEFPQWIHDHTRREVRQRWSFDM